MTLQWYLLIDDCIILIDGVSQLFLLKDLAAKKYVLSNPSNWCRWFRRPKPKEKQVETMEFPHISMKPSNSIAPREQSVFCCAIDVIQVGAREEANMHKCRIRVDP